MKRLVVLLFLWGAATGCVSTQVTKLVSKIDYPPVSPEEVQVYLNEKDIVHPYEKLAIIHMQGDATWTNEAQLIEAAKKKAAKLGANAIVVNQIKEPGSGAKIVGAILGTYVDRRGEVLAVRVFENEPAARHSVQKSANSESEEPGLELELDAELDAPSTRLPNFRAAVPKSKKLSDEKILELYRKKYPKLKDKSDEELIEIIERTYAKKLKKQKQN